MNVTGFEECDMVKEEVVGVMERRGEEERVMEVKVVEDRVRVPDDAVMREEERARREEGRRKIRRKRRRRGVREKK